MMTKSFSVQVGDRVAYSVAFLKSIGMSHSDMAHGRGTITGLSKITAVCIIAVIAWDNGCDLPGRVNVQNLARVGPNRRYANCD